MLLLPLLLLLAGFKRDDGIAAVKDGKADAVVYGRCEAVCRNRPVQCYAYAAGARLGKAKRQGVKVTKMKYTVRERGGRKSVYSVREHIEKERQNSRTHSGHSVSAQSFGSRDRLTTAYVVANQHTLTTAQHLPACAPCCLHSVDCAGMLCDLYS